MGFSTWEGVKIWEPGVDRTVDYEFHFRTRIPAGATLSVAFRVTSQDVGGNTVTHLESEIQYTNSGTDEEEADRVESFPISNVPPQTKFAMFVDSVLSDATVLAMPEARGPLMGPVFVRAQGPFALEYEINPYNKEFDADPRHGLTYEVATGSEVVFEPLSDDAPGARYIFGFGDRLIALQDFGDRQLIAASADGDIRQWTGPDTYSSYLLDAQIDPIDDLMAGAHIGGGNFALYRKRSIWRGFETGNVQLPIGVVPWIVGIGTEFRFSVQIVPGGNIFLGSDSMVYLLTEGGQLTALGGPIKDWIVKHLTAEDILVDYDLVDSLFDSWRQEYWLAIPADGAEVVTHIWIFDLGLFYREQKLIWRERPMPHGVRRLAAVTMLPDPTLQ